jgi:hypothetical protein
MAIYEVTEDTVVQRCGHCQRENRIALASLVVGIEHGGRRDGRMLPLPACPGCRSTEFLSRSADGEDDHPAPGTFGHLHRLLVDHLHAELVQRAQVASGFRTVDSRPDPRLVRPLGPTTIQRWFPRGMKLEPPSAAEASTAGAEHEPR